MTGLTGQDHAEIDALTGEIMHLVDNCTTTADLQQSIKDLLTRRVAEAARAYDAQLAAEQVHPGAVLPSGASFGPHPISDCRIDRCGRHPGQRRDTPAGRTGCGTVNDDDEETLAFADESDDPGE